MKITFINGEQAGKTYEFVLPQITVGREDANDLRLPTEGVSRYHARFKQELLQGGWTICDQGSTNGVKVNGERISGEYFLSENDQVEIGEQLLMVSDLSGEPPKILFNPVNRDTPGLSAGPAPGTVLEEKTPLPAEEEKEDNSTLFDSLRNKPLFSDTPSASVPEPAPSAPGRRMSPLLFYTILGCAAVMAITSCIKILSPAPATRNATSADREDLPLSLMYEKVEIQRDNVFRFSLVLEGSQATFTIDDIKSRRHPEALVVKNPTGLDVLKSRINASGIWNMPAPGATQDASGLRRRLGIMSGAKVVDLVIDGQRSPAAFEDVESAIYEFAEGCGMQTVSLSGDEIMRLANNNFHKAEDLYANRESDPANLRDAISRYRVAVNYLSQFSPPPAMLKTAKIRLQEAEKLRNAKLEELEYNRVRLQNVRDFDSLRRVFMQTMALTEPESKIYNVARKRLHILDVRLKKRRGSR